MLAPMQPRNYVVMEASVGLELSLSLTYQILSSIAGSNRRGSCF